MSEVESLINIPVEHCSNIFGQFDEYVKKIEKTLKVTIIASDDELDRMKYLRDTELLMLLGDGVTLDMKHNSKFDLQISNPNLHRVNIYPSTPYIGFKGCLLMIEKILNIKL